MKIVDDNNNTAQITLNYSWAPPQSDIKCPEVVNYCDDYICRGEPEPEIHPSCDIPIPMCDCKATSMGGAVDYIFPVFAIAMLAFVIISSLLVGPATPTEKKVYEEE